MAVGTNGTMRKISAGAIGNMLEWYGFSIYGLFAVQIGGHFFRAGDPVSHALAAFGVFAVGAHAAGLGRRRRRRAGQRVFGRACAGRPA